MCKNNELEKRRKENKRTEDKKKERKWTRKV